MASRISDLSAPRMPRDRVGQACSGERPWGMHDALEAGRCTRCGWTAPRRRMRR